MKRRFVMSDDDHRKGRSFLNTPDTKIFPTSLVLSVLSATAFGDTFGAIHEAVEFVVGHPIWTHELADRRIWKIAQEAIIAQWPPASRWLQKCEGVVGSPDGAKRLLAQCIAEVGGQVSLTRGNCQRSESPLESAARLLPNKPIIAVVAPRGKWSFHTC